MKYSIFYIYRSWACFTCIVAIYLIFEEWHFTATPSYNASNGICAHISIFLLANHFVQQELQITPLLSIMSKHILPGHCTYIGDWRCRYTFRNSSSFKSKFISRVSQFPRESSRNWGRKIQLTLGLVTTVLSFTGLRFQYLSIKSQQQWISIQATYVLQFSIAISNSHRFSSTVAVSLAIGQINSFGHLP